ncbi:MAG: DUF2330 domain-containing protein [Polyangiaceae bacterium]|nr:DUF2330 domain-containing protein [Polyangiaceae bacterium]
MKYSHVFAWYSLAFLTLCLAPTAAHAFPGIYVGKSGGERVAHSTQVVFMHNEKSTVVTWMPDYEGSLDAFALVTVVPSDVTAERVVTLKRDFVDHLDKLSAPRFHEYWEMEPCEPGEPEQEWERDLTASQGTAFLGGGASFGSGGAKKSAKELFLNVNVEFKNGEYTFHLLADDAGAWLKARGYQPPADLGARLAPYLGAQMKVMVAEVDPKRIELVGGERAQLSPIQFWSESNVDTLPLRLGLGNAPARDKQEVIAYFIDKKDRFETKNYKTAFPPTNINVDFIVKEKMGEFYGALHDKFLEKNPKTFLAEYAWSAEGCGQPCATTPPEVFELLALGGHVFEQWVPEEEKNPKPPELTEDEKKAFKEELKLMEPKDRAKAKKTFEEERKLIAARKLLVQRHKYSISRLHYRFGAADLTEDPKFGPAAAGVQGGTALPTGEKGVASTEVKQASPNRFQTRFYNLHPSPVVANCTTPLRYRWGKAPRTYRGLRKIWVAEDLTRRNRKKLALDKVLLTPIPELGLKLASAEPAAKAAPVVDEKSGCRLVAVPSSSSGGWLLLASLGFLVNRRRARAKRMGS